MSTIARARFSRRAAASGAPPRASAWSAASRSRSRFRPLCCAGSSPGSRWTPATPWTRRFPRPTRQAAGCRSRRGSRTITDAQDAAASALFDAAVRRRGRCRARARGRAGQPIRSGSRGGSRLHRAGLDGAAVLRLDQGVAALPQPRSANRMPRCRAANRPGRWAPPSTRRRRGCGHPRRSHPCPSLSQGSWRGSPSSNSAGSSARPAGARRDCCGRAASLVGQSASAVA